MFQRVKKVLLGTAALVALAAGGSAIAGAATSHTTTTTTTTAAPSGSPAPAPNFPAHGTAAHEDAEKAVTGDAAAKAQAAAVGSVGGTAGAVTTDYTGTGYEVTVTKSDGSTVEVHLDSSFNAMQAPGPGGPGH